MQIFNQTFKKAIPSLTATGNSASILLTTSLFLFGNGSYADVGVTGRLEYLDNPSRSSFADNDVLRSIAADINYGMQSNRYSLLLDYSATKEDYEENLQADREFVEGAGTFTWFLVPDVLDWTVSNRRANRLLEAFGPGIADNEQIVSIISTGPTLNLPIGGSNLFSASVDYSDADFERSEQWDNERVSVSAEFTRLFSEVLSASVRIANVETEYDSTLSISNYDLTSASGVLSYNRANLGIVLEAGTYSYDSDIRNDESFPLRNATVSYQINTSSSIQASFSEAVEDLTSDATSWVGYIVDSETGGFGDVVPAAGSSGAGGIYSLDSSSIAYNYTDPSRFSFSLTYRDEDRAYEEFDRVESFESLAASFSVPFGQRTNVSLTASLDDRAFSEFAEEQESLFLTLGLTFRQSDQLNLGVEIWDVDYDEDIVQGSYNRFNDSGAAIFISYRFGDF